MLRTSQRPKCVPQGGCVAISKCSLYNADCMRGMGCPYTLRQNGLCPEPSGRRCSSCNLVVAGAARETGDGGLRRVCCTDNRSDQWVQKRQPMWHVVLSEEAPGNNIESTAQACIPVAVPLLRADECGRDKRPVRTQRPLTGILFERSLSLQRGGRCCGTRENRAQVSRLSTTCKMPPTPPPAAAAVVTRYSCTWCHMEHLGRACRRRHVSAVRTLHSAVWLQSETCSITTMSRCMMMRRVSCAARSP